MNTITQGVKKFWKDEEGLQTLELMLIIAVIVVIALMFRDKIVEWVKELVNFGGEIVGDFQQRESTD